MLGPITTSDSRLPSSPVSCRWAALANHEASESNPTLVDLPPSEQVSRGKELLSMLGMFAGDEDQEPSSFPIGDSAAMPMMPSRDIVPPPPCERPPPPPGFEVSQAAFHAEPTGQLQHQQGDLVPSFVASQPPQQQQLQQTHFPTPSAMGRPSLPVPNASPANVNTPGIWGMGAGAPGTWSPLSTNPSSMTAGWLSTRVPDTDVASQPISSTTASHVGLSSSSGSSAHYSMPMPTAAGNGLWTSPASTSSAAAPTMLPASMMPLSMATAGSLPMMQMMQQEKPKFQNQLRAEATPYVPMNLNVGVPAY